MTTGTHDIEASFNGGAYATIAASASGAFSGTLAAQAQGQGTLTVRWKDIPSTAISIATVGIGDVFIVAGQSNASGRGTNYQSYSHASLKASLFGNDYLWHDLTDPTDSKTNQVDTVSQEPVAPPAGSVWPLVATSYLANQGVPCAFVPCAIGGATISQWQPGANHQDRTTLYGSMIYRINQVGGAKAILFWEGETDAQAAMAQATFDTSLDTVADTAFADVAVKLMPCKLQSGTYTSQANQDRINNAIAAAWGDNANVLTGPDLTGLTADNGDGLNVHLQSDANLAAAATLWWNAIKAAFGW